MSAETPPVVVTAPSLDDFLKPASASAPRLSPSGAHIALIRSTGAVDEVLRVDLPSMASQVIYRTAPAPRPPPNLKSDLKKVDPAKADEKPARERITYLEWKTEDRLAISVDAPAKMTLGYVGVDVSAPVHMILAADGSRPPLLLNVTDHGKSQTVEYSSMLSNLPDDPGHVLLTVMSDLYIDRFAVRPFKTVIYRVDIADRSRVAIEKADNFVKSYGVDRRGQIISRTMIGWDGAVVLQGRTPGTTEWKTLFEVRPKAERQLAKYEVLGIGSGVLYVADKPEKLEDGDTTVVRTLDIRTLQLGDVVWSSPTYDVDSVVLSTGAQDFLGACYWEQILKCDFKDPKLRTNFKGLYKFFKDERSISIVSQSDDDSKWILNVEGPDEIGAYYLYDLKTHELQSLFSERPELGSQRLARMRPFAFTARDGAALTAYVTEPPAYAIRPGLRPLIVMPHGGPEVRDTLTFDLRTQYLATHGYEVLQPNFRGSSGYGRRFAEAGYGQWGGRMHEDVVDATKALVAQGSIDPKRVCIVGGSYGGYEAMEAAVREPDLFRCAVSIAGVSDLSDMLQWEKTFGRDAQRYRYWLKSIGDPAKDAAKLAAASPRHAVADWKTPLLLIHGDQDPIVPVSQSRDMKRTLEKAGKPVRYLEVAGMGHGPIADSEVRKVTTELATFLDQSIPPPPTAVAAAAATH